MVANPLPYQGTLCRLDLSTGGIAKYTSVVAKGEERTKRSPRDGGETARPLSFSPNFLVLAPRSTTMRWMLLCIWFLGLSAMRLKNVAWLIHKFWSYANYDKGCEAQGEGIYRNGAALVPAMELRRQRP